MFKSIQKSVVRRTESLKTKTLAQSALEKAVRVFLIQEFGLIGETLTFSASRENKKLRIRVENKTAANEVALRSGQLGAVLRKYELGVENITVE